MEQLLFSELIFLIRNLPMNNPAILDLMKLLVGSTVWIGGMVYFLYLKEKKGKELVSINK